MPAQTPELVFLCAGTGVDDGFVPISEAQKDIHRAAGISGCGGGILDFSGHIGRQVMPSLYRQQGRGLTTL